MATAGSGAWARVMTRSGVMGMVKTSAWAGDLS